MSRQIVIVTGGSRGIGAATARLLGREKASVVVNYRNARAEADAVADDIKAAGGDALAVQGDVGKEDDILRLFAETDRGSGMWPVFAARTAATTAVLGVALVLVVRRRPARLPHGRTIALAVAAGALDEARALQRLGLDPAFPAMKAIGVREFLDHFAGKLSLQEAIAAVKTETRRYAKRQTTWMRGQMADWPRITAETAEAQWIALQAFTP